jgi:hypothetical protein
MRNRFDITMWLLIAIGPWVFAGLCFLSTIRAHDGTIPIGALALLPMLPWGIAAWVIPFTKHPATCKDAPATTLMFLVSLAAVGAFLFVGYCLIGAIFTRPRLDLQSLQELLGPVLLITLITTWHLGVPGLAMWLWGADRADRLTFGPPKPATPKHRPSRANDIITILIGIAIPHIGITAAIAWYSDRVLHTATEYADFLLTYSVALVIACAFVALAIKVARRARFCREAPIIVTTYASSVTIGLLINWAISNPQDARYELVGLIVLIAWLIGMPALAMILWSRRRARKLINA